MVTLRTDLTADLARFKSEAMRVLETLVLPSWQGELHGFTDTLYGYMMRSFSYVDLLSSYWTGTSAKSQSQRMVDFMDQYMGYERKAHSLAVQLWRHKLMHTARPRALRDPQSGKTMYWLLHWFEQHLPRDQHFTFSDAGHQLNLNIGAIYLIEDLQRAASSYFADLDASPDLMRKAEAMETELNSYKFQNI